MYLLYVFVANSLLRQQSINRCEAWIKANPPKSGVSNRPKWDNDFANPESSELNARDTEAEAKKARDATFRGQFGPGYGVKIDTVPDHFHNRTFTHDKFGAITLDNVETTLEKIQQPDILELGSFLHPPHTVKVVIGAVCTILGIEPEWHIAHKGLLRNSYYFLTMLRFFDKNNVSEEVIERLQYFVSDPAFEDKKVLAASRALKQLKDWVVSVWEFVSGVELERELKRMERGDFTGAGYNNDNNNDKAEDDNEYGSENDFEDKSLPSPTASVEHAAANFSVDSIPKNEMKTPLDEASLESGVSKMSGSYVEIYDDETRSSIHSATKIRNELAEIKERLRAAVADKEEATLKFEEAERELTRNRARDEKVKESIEEAEKRAQEVIRETKDEAKVALKKQEDVYAGRASEASEAVRTPAGPP